MKKNTKKKQPIESKASATAPSAASPPSTPTLPMEPLPQQPSPVEALLREAEQEADQAILREYAPVIHVLREKHFSYREIADWLNERGFETDRNEVYRIYCKILSPNERQEESYAANMEEAEEM